jgi:hypothetical protein
MEFFKMKNMLKMALLDQNCSLICEGEFWVIFYRPKISLKIATLGAILFL